MSLGRALVCRVYELAVLLTVVEGCASAPLSLTSRAVVSPAPALTRVCAEGPELSWVASRAGETRTVVVDLNVIDEGHDGWLMYGRRRLEGAIASWNGVGIPIRLVAGSGREAGDIRVTILRRLPLDPAEPANAYRSGLTHITFDEHGALSGARVLVATETIHGESYSIADQLATLLHELGHALGLPHSTSRLALMSPRAIVQTLTPHDVALAKAVYERRWCGEHRASVTAARRG